MFIQCFIEKFDGSDVFCDFESTRYIFSKNKVGDSVCFVGNQSHASRLLSMGEAAYKKYDPPDGLSTPGATAKPLGKDVARSLPKKPGKKKTRTVPQKKKDPLPEKAEKKAGIVDIQWTVEATQGKLKEFKHLNKANFRAFINDNNERVMNWPISVRRELARKILRFFPASEPEIEGFSVDDYL